MSNNHSTSLNTTFCMSTLDIHLAKNSRKTVRSIKISTKSDEVAKDIQTTLRAGERHREEFDPPLIVISDGHIIVSLDCSSLFSKQFDVVVDINLRDVGCLRDEGHIKSYRKKIRKVEVVVAGPSGIVSQVSGVVCQPPGIVSQPSELVSQTSSELIATTTELMHACALFRILIIGNSGVGKSELIHKMFGVDEVHVSTTSRGIADIDKEFISRANERFVVHDSLGFEAADQGNIEIVKDFVRRRMAMPALKDQLHAIWICTEIPYSGGRLAETGVEQFLRHQHDIIGDIPLVIVLTKVDLLDIRLDLEPNGETPESRRSRYMDECCIRPLREAAGRDVTPVAVSARDGYSETLSNLFKTTGQNMERREAAGRDVTPVAVSARDGYSETPSDLFKTTGQNMVREDVDAAPRAMATIAQRVNVKEKIELSIAVGKNKYWQRLLTSAFFRGHTLKECLEVIRKDIIAVWNFYDPDQCLMDDNLIGALLPTDNLGDSSDSPSTVAPFGALLASGLEMAKNLSVTGDVTLAVAGSVASATISVLRMTYEAYQEAKKDMRILMAYIVDLICVMQAIFLIAPNGRVTPETVTLVLQAYEVPRKFVHMFVKGFDGTLGVLPGRDKVLDKVEELIWRHSLLDREMEKLRQRVGVSPSRTL